MAEAPTLDNLIDIVRKGDLDKLDEALAAGAPVNEATPEGNTALMYACAKGKESVIQRLIAAGAKPRHENKWGMTPFDWSKWAPDEGAVKTLLANA